MLHGEEEEGKGDLQGEMLKERRLHGGVMNDASLGSHSSICPSLPPCLTLLFPPFFAPSLLSSKNPKRQTQQTETAGEPVTTAPVP